MRLFIDLLTNYDCTALDGRHFGSCRAWLLVKRTSFSSLNSKSFHKKQQNIHRKQKNYTDVMARDLIDLISPSRAVFKIRFIDKFSLI